MRTRLLHAHGASFLALASKSFLSDWTAEIAESSRIADPQFGMVRSGVAINALGHCEAEADHVELRLDLQLLGFTWDEPLAIRMSGEALAPGKIVPEDESEDAPAPKTNDREAPRARSSRGCCPPSSARSRGPRRRRSR